MSLKFSFVIPVYNNYHLLHRLLLDILQKASPVYEVIIMDDASTEEKYYEGLKWWKSQFGEKLKVYRSRENRGFLLNANKGLDLASGDVVILVSTDVRIYKNIVSIVTELLKINPKRLISGTVYQRSTGWNDFDGTIYPYAEGYLLAATKKAWNDIGYFDEQYQPFDYEDMDLSTTALSKGYELTQLPDGSVKHLGGQSIGYNEKREAQTKINQRKFREKWVK